MRIFVTLLASLALGQAGPLHQAARACDADRMRKLLSRHPALNEMDENGMLPLHIAINGRQMVCVGLLLDGSRGGASGSGSERAGRLGCGG